jgi:hypothetical protein
VIHACPRQAYCGREHGVKVKELNGFFEDFEL